MISVHFTLYVIFKAPSRSPIAVRLARFLLPLMAWCIFNKKLAHSYTKSTWTLQIILVYLILNFCLKQTDFLCHEERGFLLCKRQTTNKEPERAVQTTVRRTDQAIRTYYFNIKKLIEAFECHIMLLVHKKFYSS